MQKNVASQKLIVFAFDATTNLPKTGDAANITAYVSIDYGSVTVLGDASATEMDATNAKGYYLFDLTQGETNGNTLLFSAKSATSNIVVIGAPASVQTVPSSFVVAPGSANALLVAGSNAATTFSGLTTGALSCTTITASGAVAFQSTFAVTTSTSLAALSATTITASGTTSLAAVTTSGTVTLNALTISNAFTVSGATTLTGVVTATNAGNDIRGVTIGQAFPANFAALSITAGGLVSTQDWTVQLTESYRANGAAPTPAQAVCEILAHLGEMAIVGTTKTVNKFDHTTPAETFTLDSATAPTSIRRAT